MDTMKKYIVLDIGGSGGRCVVSGFDGAKIQLKQVNKFKSNFVQVLDTKYWDILRLFDDLKNSLAEAKNESSHGFSGIGVDTMGVSFALLDHYGDLISNPLYSRVPQKEEMMDEVFKQVSKEELYSTTGLQLTKLNSLYHMTYLSKYRPKVLERAEVFLMLPDLLNYWLSGEKCSEYSSASTSHLLDATTKLWARELIEKMNFPTDIFPKIITSGTILGELHPSVGKVTAIKNTQIIASGSHDTASAIMSIPLENRKYAFLSSGTWGILGIESDAPIINKRAREYNFANEGGANGKITFVKNTVNLWILQQCMDAWQKEGNNYSWTDLDTMVEQADPFLAYIDPSDPDFLIPDNMPLTIQEYCCKTDQAIPQSRGEIARVIIESLAMKYKFMLSQLIEICGQKPEVFYIIGGGSKDKFLCQCTANVLGIPVIAGLCDATVYGNTIIQMVALGDISNYSEGKEVIKNSSIMTEYEPKSCKIWSEKFIQTLKLQKP